MTAAELTLEVLDRRNIRVKEKDYWSCWEICDKEEMGESNGKARLDDLNLHFLCLESNKGLCANTSKTMQRFPSAPPACSPNY